MSSGILSKRLRHSSSRSPADLRAAACLASDITGSATLAGTFDLALVNGFSPSVGQVYPVLTFASVTGSFSTFTGLNPFFTESPAATAPTWMISELPLPTWRRPHSPRPPLTNVGQSITVNWQAMNQSGQAVPGSWQDSVYLSSTPTITSSSTLLVPAVPESSLAGNATYSASLTKAVPSLAPGNYDVIVQVDSLYQVPDPNRANDVLAATSGQFMSVFPS